MRASAQVRSPAGPVQLLRTLRPRHRAHLYLRVFLSVRPQVQHPHRLVRDQLRPPMGQPPGGQPRPPGVRCQQLRERQRRHGLAPEDGQHSGMAVVGGGRGTSELPEVGRSGAEVPRPGRSPRHGDHEENLPGHGQQPLLSPAVQTVRPQPGRGRRYPCERSETFAEGRLDIVRAIIVECD